MYYILSLKHTNPKDEFITLWRKDSSGYCFSAQSAGVYHNFEDGYHDSEDTMPVHVSIIDELFISVTYDGEKKSMLLNHPTIWRELGLKLYKGSLTRIEWKKK